MAKNMDMVSSRTKIKVSTGYRVFQVCNTILMILVCVITLYPFLYLVAQSFSSESAIVQGLVKVWPVEFNLTTYKSVISKGDFIRYYGNTIFYAVIGTVGSLLFRKQLNLFFIFTMYFGGGMIPNYVLMTYLGLRDTVAAFILPGLIGTYYVLLMKSFFAGIPRELEEAGSIDGLTHIGIFFKIVLPLSKPIMATMALFYMTGYWSNWFNAFLYLDDKKKWPVAYYLRQIINGSATSNDPGATADAAQIASNIKSCCMVLTAAPLICIYPFIQKYFVQGMMLGGVKE